MKRFANLTIFLVSVGLMTNCKPAKTESSSVKSLDKFAGDSGLNQCEGRADAPWVAQPAVRKAIKVDDSLRDLTESLIAASPRKVLDAFFNRYHGSVEVLPQAQIDDHCGGLKSSENGAAADAGRIISCWRDNGGKPTIYVANTTAAIKHSMIRAFGYFTAENWFKSSLQVRQKADIGKAFLADVAHSSQYDLKHFNQYLLDDVLIPDDNLRNRRLDSLDQLPTYVGSSRSMPLYAALRNAFYNYVFAEAYDSYFCSASKTRKALAQGGVFQRTGDIANSIFAAMTSEGFGLQDEESSVPEYISPIPEAQGQTPALANAAAQYNDLNDYSIDGGSNESSVPENTSGLTYFPPVIDQLGGSAEPDWVAASMPLFEANQAARTQSPGVPSLSNTSIIQRAQSIGSTDPALDTQQHIAAIQNYYSSAQAGYPNLNASSPSLSSTPISVAPVPTLADLNTPLDPHYYQNNAGRYTNLLFPSVNPNQIALPSSVYRQAGGGNIGGY